MQMTYTHGREFTRELVPLLQSEPLSVVVDHLTCTNPRIEQMCAHYRQFPEDYYREAPIDGGMYIIDTGDGSRLVASNRLKRFRRPTDLLRVRGICLGSRLGPKTLRRMLPHLVVDPPPPDEASPDGGGWPEGFRKAAARPGRSVG